MCPKPKPQTLKQAFSFDGPALSTLLPANGGSTGGASITLSGRNLGQVFFRLYEKGFKLKPFWQ